MARVLVAMSGGVDSAVAAARLVEAGHETVGVHLRLADRPRGQQVPGQGCCSLDDARDARRAAQVLGIAFYVWDLGEVFDSAVQQPFTDDYARGVTPNPCVTCNDRVKYRALLDRARRLGFDALATGHHVRLRRWAGDVRLRRWAGDVRLRRRTGDVRLRREPPEGWQRVTEPGPGARLWRAADADKDQSYVLYMARAGELAHSLFPVGELTKQQVRDRAARLGLRVADKPDSYDICFVPDGDTDAYLTERLPAATGEIVDIDGTVLGHHEGVWHYTIGQRRGLGLDHHERRYVVSLDAGANRVVVGPREALECRWLELSAASWTTGAPPVGAVRVQIRAHGSSVPARLQQRAGSWRLELDEPVLAAARGQAAVVYDRWDRGCLGGGRITAADRTGADRTGAGV